MAVLGALTNQTDHGKFQLITLQGGGTSREWGTVRDRRKYKGCARGQSRSAKNGHNLIGRGGELQPIRLATNNFNQSHCKEAQGAGGTTGVRTRNFKFWTFFFVFCCLWVVKSWKEHD